MHCTRVVPCDAFLLEHQGIKKEKIDDRDFSILIKDSNVQEKFVRISGIPYQMNLGIVKTWFKYRSHDSLTYNLTYYV